MKTLANLAILALGLLAVGCGGLPRAVSSSARAPWDAVAPAGSSGTVCRIVQRGVDGGARDTRVAERWPDRSYGTEEVAFAGRVGSAARYVLLDFDLPAVPPGAEILSATLIVTAASSSGPSRVTAHRITAAWNELTTTWSSFAGGFDAYEEAVVRTRMGMSGAANFDVTRLVRAWHRGDQTQLGILLRQDDANTTFATSEAPSTAQRPRLEVCFSAPAASPG